MRVYVKRERESICTESIINREYEFRDRQRESIFICKSRDRERQVLL